MITSIDAKSTKSKDLYRYLSDAITPRPIAFVSSIDKEGNKNLSPFSFFNVFSIDPPVLVFSPVKRTRDNTNKDTLKNVKEINECVISLVTEEIAQQVSLASCEFDSSINEFKKAGKDLPRENHYGVGMIFLPTSKKEQDKSRQVISKFLEENKLQLFHIRDVPVKSSILSVEMKKSEPAIKQFFVKIKGKLNSSSNNLASSSFFADVVIAISRPLILSIFS